VRGTFNDRGLHRIMSEAVYDNVGSWEFYRLPVSLEVAFFVLALILAVPKDRARRMIWKHGRRLRGPELVTTAEFNEKLGKSKLLTTHLPDGIALINEERSWIDKVMRNDLSRWARVPRDREAMHFLIVGDSGTGKSAAIRQILSQVWERGEAAIVYDPAMEYLPQFYNEARGDVVLNPLDARCPFWTPGDEVPHEAEALTLSVSLFPDQGRENRFFVEAPRKIFAHLINLRPTPEELTYWMANADEIDKRIAGTEMAAMIEKGAANQRSGVLGSLNMVADAFKLLPRESETKQRWSTVEWAKERKGWVFLTSKPTMRERMRPLISLWLDLLVLRLMNEESSTRKTWFVLDELASLQHLPQLKTAVTENRKSNNPMVLGFQGKAQVEALYGHVAEAMLSQPATKIFLKTSEPHASEWISKAIGEIEIERFRESRTVGRFAKIAREYVRSPENTLVVSPDNESRREINTSIHRAMQNAGQVKDDEHRVHVLYARQDITGVDRQYAQNYERGDVIRYSKGSKPLGIEAGEYARVSRTEPENNTVTVTRKSGEELSYDPRRLQGVTVYRDTERTFAEGDRVQLTAPYHEQKLANRELGTVEQIDGGGNLKLKMDSGREVEFNARQHPHLDYGYAVTSHSSQGQTADRVLIHVDSEQAHGELLNSRMAYVSISRAQYDAQIYTNDAATLGQELSRDVSKSIALEGMTIAKSLDPQPVQQIVEQLGLGLSL